MDRSPNGAVSHSTAAKPTVAIVILPVTNRNDTDNAGEPDLSRGRDDRLTEAVGLAEAIGLVIADRLIVPVRKALPATLLGTGKVEEIAELVKTHEAALVVVDHPLTPVQQRNLEKAWTAKVVDRTSLILEIFGDRAQTREGRLQVELAHLNYQRSRLVRSWTHLERQRGGFGFLGGPGETQIEADRRQIQGRIKQIEKLLEGVRNMRSVHRAQRKRSEHPTVALVGYTNAGKSTLFNRLTGAGILAKNMLFATLDPTLRRVKLPHGEEIILSDTVGFISDLPTSLVAAFRATLEEVLEADLILHVRDIATPESEPQAADVMHVLAELGIMPGANREMLEVWNKVDLLDPEQLHAVELRAERDGVKAVAVSSVTGEGIDALLSRITEILFGGRRVMTVRLAPNRMGGSSWLYEHTEVLGRTDDPDDGSAEFQVRISEKRIESFLHWAAQASAEVSGLSDDQQGAALA
ncbi:GTP-binding protein HflX [Faunimonas pinastri]|uniref:GTPase HflX n=1 Tax=Faunimonas pinastri TaxID=1855383 RepID=A0A1H9N6M1_9HYPH|nr:GTPase HflX [Faunimonas pinastri]SER31574.1 GTP-binding protein HflX [Faunimonas pinastri]